MKSLYYQALSHYYTSTAISTEELGLLYSNFDNAFQNLIFFILIIYFKEDCCDDSDIVELYNDLHDKSELQTTIDLKNSFSNETYQKFFKRQFSTAQLFYSANVLKDSNRYKLGWQYSFFIRPL